VCLINTKAVKNAFAKVKKEMEVLNTVQQSMAYAVNQKFEDSKSEIQHGLEAQKKIHDTYEKELNQVVTNLNKELTDQLQKNQKDQSELTNRKLSIIKAKIIKLEESNNNKFLKINNQSDSSSEKLAELKKSVNKHKRTLSLISSKLQEFENISVDIDDVESTFVSSDEFSGISEQLDEMSKQLNKQAKTIDKINSQVSDYKEDKQGYARISDFERMQEDIVELKSHLVLREDIEGMHNRLDKMEERFLSRMDDLRNNYDDVSENLADVYSMKKLFVSKEQHKILRKEIKLLVSGLKDIQKIKDKIKPNKTKNSIVNFFTEEPKK